MDETPMEDCTRYATATFEILAEQIIDMIISAKLVTMQCAHDDSHGVVAVWSPAATEQIATHIQNVIQPNSMLYVKQQNAEHETRP